MAKITPTPLGDDVKDTITVLLVIAFLAVTIIPNLIKEREQ